MQGQQNVKKNVLTSVLFMLAEVVPFGFVTLTENNRDEFDVQVTVHRDKFL